MTGAAVRESGGERSPRRRRRRPTSRRRSPSRRCRRSRSSGSAGVFRRPSCRPRKARRAQSAAEPGVPGPMPVWPVPVSPPDRTPSPAHARFGSCSAAWSTRMCRCWRCRGERLPRGAAIGGPANVDRRYSLSSLALQRMSWPDPATQRSPPRGEASTTCGGAFFSMVNWSRTASRGVDEARVHASAGDVDHHRARHGERRHHGRVIELPAARARRAAYHRVHRTAVRPARRR
jgi:hypothetical protein